MGLTNPIFEITEGIFDAQAFALMPTLLPIGCMKRCGWVGRSSATRLPILSVARFSVVHGLARRHTRALGRPCTGLVSSPRRPSPVPSATLRASPSTAAIFSRPLRSPR